jgi:glycosyltransferase involved in cell wall biosynthesis
VITSHPGATSSSDEDGFAVVRNRRPPDALLRLRRFHDHLSHVPLSYMSLRSGDEDVAHAFYATDALAAVGWGQQTGRPSVFSYMGIPSRATATWQRGRMKILEHVTREASAVIGLSRTACDALWRWWGVEAHIVYPGVDLSAFAAAQKRRADVPVIACAASPEDERKRIPLLIEAFALVRRERRRARLVLMRPRDPATERLLEEPGIEFFERRPGAAADVFAEAWVSALPSYDEAFGLVVVESLASGTPVVAAAEGGPAEILDREGIGTLFAEPTPEAVARALLDGLELAEDKGTEDRARARAADFSAERTATEHERLYEELLAQ